MAGTKTARLGAMARSRDRDAKMAELQLVLRTVAVPLQAAKEWLDRTPHRLGCQCHRCSWAHGVVAGRIKVDFETWRQG